MKAKINPWKLLVFGALVLGTGLLYFPALHFDFVNYDDPLYVVNNPHIRSLDGRSLLWSFHNDYGAHLWHPVTWISHMLDYHFYGLQAGGHHATNVALHILNSTLLFAILHRLTKTLWRSAMVAALFAWHPLHVESVAWIAERKDVLSAFFWMLTMWAYVRYAGEDGKSASRGKYFYALALLCFAVGLMAKPVLVTLPLVLLLLDWWPLRRFQAQDGGTGRPPALPLVLEKIPFLALSMIASFMTLQAASPLLDSPAALPLSLRFQNALLLYVRYLEKMVWPRGLVVVYPLDFHGTGAEIAIAGLFLAAVSVAAIRSHATRPFWLTGWLWYLGILVPAIGLVDLGTPAMADHNTYLCSIGIFIIVCWEMESVAGGWKNGRAILAIGATAVLGACLVLSAKQLRYWRNTAALYQHNLAVMPDNYAVRANYAAYLRDNSQLDEAFAQCEQAIRLSPSYAWSHDVLGGVLVREGKLTEAAKEFHTGLRLAPNRMDVHLALAGIALDQNLPGEAITNCAAVLAADPADPVAHYVLGQALSRQKKWDEALAQYAGALRYDPGYADAHFQMAVLLSAQHQTGKAITHYRSVLAAQPNRVDVLNNLAWILATDPAATNRNGAEAVALAGRACDLTGGKIPKLLGTLAAACAEAGRFDEAIATAQRAVDLAIAANKQEVAGQNRELLSLYRSHRPYREQ